MSGTIAVDFDGVIHAYSRGWDDGTIYDELVPGALEAIRALQERYAVFVFTTRDALQVRNWLEDRGVTTAGDHYRAADNGDRFWNDQDVVLVTDRKLPAIAYIDDRAIRFESWDQALADLGKYEPG